MDYCGLFINHFGDHELHGNESSSEIGVESPPSSTTGMFADHKAATTTSPKRSRRSMQKRVVSIPIKDVEGSRLKGESAPPSDSWAWRKYGQKPIKGSPYPRGYYRCSSSKGCPARKQVERSRLDPTMLVVTYSCEHNHPGPPASRNNNHNNRSSYLTDSVSVASIETPAQKKGKSATFTEPDDTEEKFGDLSEESLIIDHDEFGWFGDMASTSSSTILENPLLITKTSYDIDAEMTMFFPMIKEEDESLFADLGELPDCSIVFRRGLSENDEGRQCTPSSWCGTT